MAVTKVCEYCGAEYERPTASGKRVTDAQWARSRFCTREHWKLGIKADPTSCKVCGEHFTPERGELRCPTCREQGLRVPDETKMCEGCGGEFSRRDSKTGRLIAKQRWARKRYCNDCVLANRRGEKHWAWGKGGRHTRPDGYVTVVSHDPRFASMLHPNGRVLEHRLVMADHLGRALDPHETVHHKNGDRSDNRIENLQLRSGRHGHGVVYTCRACGSHDVEVREL